MKSEGGAAVKGPSVVSSPLLDQNRNSAASSHRRLARSVGMQNLHYLDYTSITYFSHTRPEPDTQGEDGFRRRFLGLL